MSPRTKQICIVADGFCELPSCMRFLVSSIFLWRCSICYNIRTDQLKRARPCSPHSLTQPRTVKGAWNTKNEVEIKRENKIDKRERERERERRSGEYTARRFAYPTIEMNAYAWIHWAKLDSLFSSVPTIRTGSHSFFLSLSILILSPEFIVHTNTNVDRWKIYVPENDTNRVTFSFPTNIFLYRPSNPLISTFRVRSLADKISTVHPSHVCPYFIGLIVFR